jgi:acetyl esterase/lipase
MCLLFLACSGNDDGKAGRDGGPPGGGFQFDDLPFPASANNVTYCTNGGVALKLDLARPETGSNRPAIAFFHGGGWRQGRRNQPDTETLMDRFVAEGYVTITVSYRLTSTPNQVQDGADNNAFQVGAIAPAQVQDARCAIRWLRANAETYGVDPLRIGARGHSAGGHLSMMLAHTDDDPSLDVGDHLEFSSRVQAVSSSAGPSTLIADLPGQGGGNAAALAFLGLPQNPTPAQEQAVLPLATRMSPLEHVVPGGAPTILFHGGADTTVSPENSVLMRDALEAAGIANEHHVFPGATHNALPLDPIFERTRDFFQENL